MQPNGLLRTARKGAGLSQEQLADLANAHVWRVTGRPGGLDGNAVSRMERGAIARPAERTVDALCAILSVDAAELGFERRSVDVEPIRWSADRPWRVGPEAIDAVAIALAANRRLEDQTSSAAILPAVIGLADIATVYAQEAPSRIRSRTLSLASELDTYLGWLWIAVDRLDRPEKTFDRAMSFALEAGDTDHLAHATSFKGYMAFRQGKFDQAATLSQVSQRDPNVFLALRVYDGYQEAWAYARMGDTRAAEKAMCAADRELDNVPGSEMPPGAYWYDVPFLLTQRSIVHEALGRTGEAIKDLEIGLAEMPVEHSGADWSREIRERLDVLRRT